MINWAMLQNHEIHFIIDLFDDQAKQFLSFNQIVM